MPNTEQLTARDYIIASKAIAQASSNEFEPGDYQKGSNGSEAWQVVALETKNKRELQNELKKMGFKKDSYWGYTIGAPMGIHNYYKEEVYLEALAKALKGFGIECRRVERLL